MDLWLRPCVGESWDDTLAKNQCWDNNIKVWETKPSCLTPALSLPLTFFTLCGFFSLRHLRMSISVVLTQPGCGRRQETECVSGSDNNVSPVRIVCVSLFSSATLTKDSYAKWPNLILLVTTKQGSQLNSVESWICSFQALNAKIV